MAWDRVVDVVVVGSGERHSPLRPWPTMRAPGRVAPIERPPFYAVPIHPGSTGTNGGPRVDSEGRVLRSGGGVIDGLYAAGNTAASAFGWAYPSGGGTIANAVVMGFLAGRAAGRRASDAI